jgi:flagellar hook-basal body complex protein FliE
MSGLQALLPLSTVSASAATTFAAPPAGMAAPALQQGTSFADLIAGGLHQIDQRVASADALVRSFALDDNVPLHQVTFALEQARLSVELAMQVQSRLVEGYRQLMNMQL